jgi:integrase
MRLTVLEQYARGVAHHDAAAGARLLAELERATKLRQGDATDASVFPGGNGGRSVKPLSNAAMLMLPRRMNRGDLTVHGFRSTFRDWAAETTGYHREVVEAALAHVIESKVETAYRRGDLFEKRRRLMAEWAAFCVQPTQKIFESRIDSTTLVQAEDIP